MKAVLALFFRTLFTVEAQTFKIFEQSIAEEQKAKGALFAGQSKTFRADADALETCWAEVSAIG